MIAAKKIIFFGYLVARIEQVETVFAKTERMKNNTTKESKGKNMVKRDVCAIVSPGTRTLNVRDVIFDPLNDNKNDDDFDKRTKLLSIVETVNEKNPQQCFIGINVSCDKRFLVYVTSDGYS